MHNLDPQFCLDRQLQNAYKQFSASKERPIIGLTVDVKEAYASLRERYYQQVITAGGVPLLLPPTSDLSTLISYIDLLDGVILTGGGDCDPRWYGEEKTELLGNVNELRDLPELLLARLARNRQMPTLGICRGMQMMCLASGGHVCQDISLDEHYKEDSRTRHIQQEPRDVATHSVQVDRSSILYDIYQRERLSVNSFHHQSMDLAPASFRPIAWAEDGIIEGMESSESKPFLALQWHPEWLGEEGGKVFTWLIGEAKLYKKAKALHKSILSIDSHCDTPSSIPQGGDITQRCEQVQVDVYKMSEGLLDVATMVAYVPQPIETQTWRDVMPVETDSPFDYANLLFDRTEEQVARSALPLSIAREFNDIFLNKQFNRKTLLFAVENALALGNDLRAIEKFKERGVVYITLCHNGDNQVCDSAVKSVSTWGGLSPFGQEVVKKMNETGVMIDLSHASEQTFYDVLELSARPVVCSHSNCKALCSHARNLTDEQLRRLAAKDGVCQLTLYDGFLHDNPSQADVHTFVEHVVHAVNIAGVEHVGVGSDFDGGGGIVGLRDASEMVNFTRELLRKRFSDEDIRLIWGANWLRVMSNNKVLNAL